MSEKGYVQSFSSLVRVDMTENIWFGELCTVYSMMWMYTITFVRLKLVACSHWSEIYPARFLLVIVVLGGFSLADWFSA